jgi:hypothetical protein
MLEYQSTSFSVISCDDQGHFPVRDSPHTWKTASYRRATRDGLEDDTGKRMIQQEAAVANVMMI